VEGKIERLDQTISSADEKQQYYRNRLLQIKDFNNAFELVKMAVNEKFKMHIISWVLI
jgi:hypothetical protein